MADDTSVTKDNSDASRKEGWIKGIFARKKESEESQKGTEIRIDYPTTGNANEPNFLMDIDLGRHTENVEPELALWLNDGRVVKSLGELAKALKTISGRAFSQHQENNELRDWVRDITGNAQLAGEIGAAKTKNDVVKALERHLKESGKKAKAEPAEKQEIRKAIEEIHEKPSSVGRSSPLEEREKLLEEKERQLETEEDVINSKRIALANRRYQLLKERGALEKEKFERILKRHHSDARETSIGYGNAGMPEMGLAPEYTKESIQHLIMQARASLDNGDIIGAKKTIAELKNAIECAAIEPDEIKRLEYDVLELEADLKLALLA